MDSDVPTSLLSHTSGQDMHFRLGVVQLLLARLDSTVSETAFISNRSGPANLAPNQKIRVNIKISLSAELLHWITIIGQAN